MPLPHSPFKDQAIAPLMPQIFKTAEPERGDIFKALDELTANIDLASGYLGSLEKRLSPVLVPEFAKEKGDTDGQMEVRACRAPLAGVLESQSNKVLEFGCRVSDLLKRLSV